MLNILLWSTLIYRPTSWFTFPFFIDESRIMLSTFRLFYFQFLKEKAASAKALFHPFYFPPFHQFYTTVVFFISRWILDWHENSFKEYEIEKTVVSIKKKDRSHTHTHRARSDNRLPSARLLKKSLSIDCSKWVCLVSSRRPRKVKQK